MKFGDTVIYNIISKNLTKDIPKNKVYHVTGGICKLCGKNVMATNTCTKKYVVLNGKKYTRNTKHHDNNARCHDCNIINGKIHHFNCDMEECPRCKGQLAFCDCTGKKFL